MCRPLKHHFIAYILILFTMLSSAGELFVTVAGGHFDFQGKRLKIWGYNIQAGVFPTYAEIDALVERLVRLGVNGVRLWPNQGTFRTGNHPSDSQWRAVRGDGSLLDRYDYLVYRLSLRGIFIANPVLHHFDEAAIRSSKLQEVRDIANSAPSTERLRKLHSIAPYLLQSYLESQIGFAEIYLKHRNPYTGREYGEEPMMASWELANESSFMHCLSEKNCLDGLPVAIKAALEIQLQHRIAMSLQQVENNWSSETVQDKYRSALSSIFLEKSKEFERAIRAMGSGVNVQPMAFSTHTGAPSALVHAAHAGGDYMACGAYGVPMSKGAPEDFWPFYPYLARRPAFWNLNFCKVAGKPMVVYETSFFRPYPFRADWAASTAAMALSQDWDAAFLYMYGQPKFIYQKNGGSGYGQLALPTPSPNAEEAHKKSYTYGFYHAGDRVTVMSWSIAGEIFKRLKPRSDQEVRTVHIARRSRLRSTHGYCLSDKEPCDEREQRRGTQALNCLSTRGKLVLSFDGAASSPRSEEVFRNDCSGRSDSGRPWPTDEAVWDENKVQWRIRGGKVLAVFGRFDGPMNLNSWIGLEPVRSYFGCAAVWSNDGMDIDASRDITVGACPTAENSGSRFVGKEVDFSVPYGSQFGVRSAGVAPQIVVAPSVKVTLRGAGTWHCTYFDFDFDVLAVMPCGSVIDLSASSDVYTVRMKRDNQLREYDGK